jgi:hypothetical protein
MATTTTTFDFGANSEVIAAVVAKITELLAPAIASGNTSEFPTFSPAMDPAVYPPSSGVYTSTRTWNDGDSATAYASALTAFVNAEAGADTFVTSGPTVS